MITTALTAWALIARTINRHHTTNQPPVTTSHPTHPAGHRPCAFYEHAYSVDSWLDGDLVGAPIHHDGPMHAAIDTTAHLNHPQLTWLCASHHDWLTARPDTATRLGLETTR